MGAPAAAALVTAPMVTVGAAVGAVVGAVNGNAAPATEPQAAVTP
ncbi:hypothetical protein [Nocardia veterana]|nr:hypothetical protein [Nocardia veterana]